MCTSVGSFTATVISVSESFPMTTPSMVRQSASERIWPSSRLRLTVSRSTKGDSGTANSLVFRLSFFVSLLGLLLLLAKTPEQPPHRPLLGFVGTALGPPPQARPREPRKAALRPLLPNRRTRRRKPLARLAAVPAALVVSAPRRVHRPTEHGPRPPNSGLRSGSDSSSIWMAFTRSAGPPGRRSFSDSSCCCPYISFIDSGGLTLEAIK